MNITYDNFIELQPDTDKAGSNQRLWNFLLISLLLHLLLVELLIDYASQSARSNKIIPPLTITLNRVQPATRSIPVSPPVTPVKETDKTEKNEKSVKQVIPLTVPTTAPQQITTILPAQPEQEPLLKAKQLVEKSLAEAAQAAKKMEERGSPDVFMTKTDKNKLLMAMMMVDQQDPKMDNPDKLQVYSNQYGDRIFQTGDNCSVIPAVLFLYTFKEINSIIATPMMGGCPGNKKEKGFSLK